MFLFSPVRVSEFVMLTKSLDWPDVFVSLRIVLATPNLSMVPVSLSVYSSFSWVELLRLTRDPNSTCSSSSSFSSWGSSSSLVPTPMVNGKMYPKVFLTLSENDEDDACFSVTPAIMALSVGDLLVVTIAVEMSDSSDISSRSSVPVEVAKSWHCSTGVDSLASLLFLSLPVHAFPDSHAWPVPDGPQLLA